MPASSGSIHLTLQLNTSEESDAEELDSLTRQLLTEIQGMEVESVELVKDGELPEGAKSAELVTLGSLAVAVLPSVVPKLVEFLQSWATRAENRIVKVKAQVENRSIEVEYSPGSMSVDELQHLVKTLTEALPPAGKSKPD